MGYVVTAKWTAKEGEENAVLAAIQALIPLSRAEPGCRFYQPNRDPENPRVFFFYEIYDDEAAFAAHCQAPHFHRFDETSRPLIATKRVERCTLFNHAPASAG